MFYRDVITMMNYFQVRQCTLLNGQSVGWSVTHLFYDPHVAPIGLLGLVKLTSVGPNCILAGEGNVIAISMAQRMLVGFMITRGKLRNNENERRNKILFKELKNERMKTWLKRRKKKQCDCSERKLLEENLG